MRGDMQNTNSNKTIFAVVLAAFLALHAYAFYRDGLLGGILAVFENINGWGMVFLADLVICLGLTCAWIIRDAKQRGVSALPYVALTATTGSIGTLLYLLRKRA